MTDYVLSPPPPDLPARQPEETAKAYAAFVRYVLLGEQRSCEKVAEEAGQGPQQIYRWHRANNWQARAASYDAEVNAALANAAFEARRQRYLAELEDHRERYGKLGKTLCKMAEAQMGMIARSIRGETIEGKDGKFYLIPQMVVNQNAISVVARVLTTAADLEAHALGLDKLIPQLTDEYE